MYLLIDPSVFGQVSLTLFDTEKQIQKLFEGVNKDLLVFIDTFLKENTVSPNELNGIAVLLGVGGFSSTRIAVTIANTFGYANKIPVLGVTHEEHVDFSKMIKRLEVQPIGQYIIAAYSAEPNITQKKSV